MEYLIVDGYNIINAWKDIFNLKRDTLEDCRNQLLLMLSNYQALKKIEVVVVFDAYQVKKCQNTIEKYDNLTVVFTRENFTADNYIERFVYNKKPKDIVRVVTADYLQQTTILSIGGIRMTPNELKSEISFEKKHMKKTTAKNKAKTNTIEANLNPKILEQLKKLQRDEE